jgi:hypothetical protein
MKRALAVLVVLCFTATTALNGIVCIVCFSTCEEIEQKRESCENEPLTCTSCCPSSEICEELANPCAKAEKAKPTSVMTHLSLLEVYCITQCCECRVVLSTISPAPDQRRNITHVFDDECVIESKLQSHSVDERQSVEIIPPESIHSSIETTVLLC